MTNTLQIDWIKSEAFNLENCCNDNPLNILGPHQIQNSWVIRVWMPEADQVSISFKNQEVATTNPNHKWLFEAYVPEDPQSNYSINVLRGGIKHTQLDPWAFKDEWMGEIDRHLLLKGITITFGRRWGHTSLKWMAVKE